MISKFNFTNFVRMIMLYIISLIFILDCNSVWVAIPQKTIWINYINFICIIICFFILMYSNKSHVIVCTKKALMWIIIIAFLGGIYVIVKPVNVIDYLSHLGILLIFILYFNSCYKGGTCEVIDAFKNMVILLAIISLFFWLFGTVLHIIHPSGSVYSGWTGVIGKTYSVPSYFHLYFETQNDSRSFLRNSGIFAESPMYSFCLSVALIFEVFLSNNPKLYNIIILGISIITTNSTTGYILLIIIIVYELYFEIKWKKSLRMISWILALIIIPNAMQIIINLFILKTKSYSGSIRADDFRIGIQAWMDNWLFGGGFKNIGYLQSYMGSWRSSNVGFSNSITYVMATGGVYLTMPILIVVIYCIYKGATKCRSILFFTMSFLYLFTFTIVPFNYITLFVFVFLFFYNLSNANLFKGKNGEI